MTLAYINTAIFYSFVRLSMIIVLFYLFIYYFVCVLCLSAVSSHSMSYVDHRFFSPFILKNNELFVLYRGLEFSDNLPLSPAPFLSPTTSFSRTPKSYPQPPDRVGDVTVDYTLITATQVVDCHVHSVPVTWVFLLSQPLPTK